MSEIKIKVDTRISEELHKRVLRIAAAKYDGNLSLALRMLIKEGVEIIEHKDWSEE